MGIMEKSPDIVFDAEAIAAGIRAACGPCEAAEEFCRDYLAPALNNAYQRGKVDAAAWLNISETETGGPLNDLEKRHLAGFLECLNAAYAKGQRAAIEEAVRG